MSDEDRIRSLLTLAAELPDDIQVPVGSLLERGRRRRRLRATAAVIGAAAVVAAAVTVPAAIRSLGTGQAQIRNPGHIIPGLPPGKPTGPTAAQLSHFHWSSLPPSPLGTRSDPLLTWTGRYLIELAEADNEHPTAAGAAYEVATHRWHRITGPPNTLGLANAVTVWTGHQLFVTDDTVPPYWVAGVGAPADLYNPRTNHWTATDMPVQLLGNSLVAAWTGREIVVAAVSGTRHPRLSVAAYDPATRRWTMITPMLPASHPPVAAELVATPARVMLWSLWSKTTKVSKNGYSVRSGVDVLSLGRTGWTTVTGAWPQHQTVDGPVYAGGRIFLAPSQIWCGICSHPFAEYRSRLVDPATLAITQIPAGPLATEPLVQADLWVWTGRTAIAANTSGQSGQRITQLAAYDPPTSSWHYLPRPPRAAIAQTPLWAGRQLLLLTSTGALLALHR
jgi:hypothetical protein